MTGAMFEQLADALASVRVPSICALNGSAFGGGVELALCCDLRIGVEGIRLSVPAAGLDLHHTHPVWSPDGRSVAYAVVDDDGAFGHIFTVSATGLSPTQLTFGAVTDMFPDWQPR